MSPVSPGPITRTVRQALILELLDQNLVSSQMQLSELLKNKGVEITQGTLSRDLDELGAKKIRPDSGRAFYAVGKNYEKCWMTCWYPAIIPGTLRCCAPRPGPRPSLLALLIGSAWMK